MSSLKKAYYMKCFESEFFKKKATEFQSFFSDIMGKKYPGDFIGVCPWGQFGDRKNDGYLRSKRILFGVYAPKDMNSSVAVTKIKSDFERAIPRWREYFDCWTFVYNSQDLPPHILQLILDITNSHKEIKVECCGFEVLRREIESMDEGSLSSIFGFAPSEEDMLDINMKEIKAIVDSISRMKPSINEIKPVSKRKLEYNSLSPESEILLNAGMKKAPLVEKYFKEVSDTLLGDKIAEVFNDKYKGLKQKNLPSDLIFLQLWEFVGGANRKEPRYEAAVLAILAHFFTYCDIFENPPEEQNDITN